MDTREVIEELNRRCGISGTASVVAGNGGLPKVRISTPACSAEIYLHGAHVTSWKPAGAEEVLFVSSTSRWKTGERFAGAYRFAFRGFEARRNPKAPAHGFVRTKAWQLESIAKDGDAIAVRNVHGKR